MLAKACLRSLDYQSIKKQTLSVVNRVCLHLEMAGQICASIFLVKAFRRLKR